MKNFLSEKIIGIIGYFYERLYHEKVSDDIEKFIKNLSYLGIATIISSLFTFPFNILAGRWLGPSEYGIFTLIQSIAMFLYIPMLLGFHSALVKYNAEKIEFLRQRSIISTALILVFLLTIASILFYLIFLDQIIAFFSITEDIFYLSLVFAVLFVFYTLMTETLRSLHKIKDYSLLKVIFSIILFFSFLIFIFFFKDLSYTSPLFAMLIAYGITGGIILASLRKYIQLDFSWEWAHKLYSYSTYSLMSGIAAVFYLNIGKIIINIYLPVSMVGIYFAYYFSYTTVILLLMTLFATVFFPVASACQNKRMLFNRLNKVVMLFIIIGWPLALISGYVIFKMYGNEYPFDLSLSLLFATAGVLISIDNLYGQLLCSVSVNGAKISSYGAITMGVASVIFSFLLIPIFGLAGAIVATIIAYGCYGVVMLVKLPTLINSY